MADSYLDLPLGKFLDLVAAREPAPGGGSVAAVTVALSGGLVEMAARFAMGRIDDSDRIIGDAARLRRRAAELAELDAQVYGQVIAATSEEGRHDDPSLGEERVRAALHRASEVPLEIAELGAETARLAARLAADGNPNLRGDSVTALRLAEAAVVSAANLVAINVAAGQGDEELVRRAEECVWLAHNAAPSDPDAGE